MGAQDPIASNLGHGQLGIAYDLRTWHDILEQSNAQRHIYITLKPVTLMNSAGWTSEGGGVYSQALDETFEGRRLWAIGVRTDTEALTRQKGSISGDSQFYHDGTTLYVRNASSVNPSGKTTVAQLGIEVGSHGVWQPDLHPNLLDNASFEEALSGDDAPGWTRSESLGTGSCSSSLETGLRGYCLRMTFSGPSGVVARLYRQTFSIETGAKVRFSGAYRTTGDALAYGYVKNGSASEYVLTNGKEIQSSQNKLFEGRTNGQWRRFCFDFAVPPTFSTTDLRFGGQLDNGGDGTVDIDDVRVSVIESYRFFDPILADGGLPTIENARPDIFFGPVSVGVGSLELMNGNGRFEPLLAAYDWHNVEAEIRVGGRYPDDGNEIGIEDCELVISGRLSNPRVSDTTVSFDLADDRQIMKKTLPYRRYDYNADVGQQDQGRVRPLGFGYIRNARPARIGLSANGLGIYEFLDPQFGSARTPGHNDVACYVDEESAAKQDATRRVTLKSWDFSWTGSTNQLEILRDVAPKIVSADNCYLDFDIGGSALHATITPDIYLPAHSSGLYSGSKYLCDTIETAMNTAAGVSDISVTLSGSTHKFTIAKGAGTLNLRCNTGTNRDASIWNLIGFDLAADKTGSLSYAGDYVVFDSPDKHVIRVDWEVGSYAMGYLDDGAGTWTGTVGANISKPSDIARFVLVKVLGVPWSQIDTYAFDQARSSTNPVGIYIGCPSEETIEAADFFERLGNTVGLDVISVNGVWTCSARTTTPPSGAVELDDSDILEFAGFYDPDDNFSTVRVAYAQDASTGNERTKDQTSTDAKVRFDRDYQRTFKTYNAPTTTGDSDASSRASWFQARAEEKPAHYEILSKGKGLKISPAGYFTLTRTRGLGSPSGLGLRVISKRDDWQSWTSRIIAVESNP